MYQLEWYAHVDNNHFISMIHMFKALEYFNIHKQNTMFVGRPVPSARKSVPRAPWAFLPEPVPSEEI